jgi:hypothetical protein
MNVVQWHEATVHDLVQYMLCRTHYTHDDFGKTATTREGQRKGLSLELH